VVAPGVADLDRLGIVAGVELERFVDVPGAVDAEDSILLAALGERLRRRLWRIVTQLGSPGFGLNNMSKIKRN